MIDSDRLREKIYVLLNDIEERTHYNHTTELQAISNALDRIVFNEVKE